MNRKRTNNILTTICIVLFGLATILCSRELFESQELNDQDRYIQELRFQNIDVYLNTTQQR